MNTFEMKTAIHFGADALGRLKDIPYKRVLVVTDPFVVKSGMIDMITKPLQAGGKEFDIFCDVVPDAPVGKLPKESKIPSVSAGSDRCSRRWLCYRLLQGNP